MKPLVIGLWLSALCANAAAPLVTEASLGLDSHPKSDDDTLQMFASTVALAAHATVFPQFSVGADLSWSRHDANHVLSDCFECIFPTRADFFRVGPSVRWSFVHDAIELYLQAGPQLAVAVEHLTGVVGDRDRVLTGFGAAVRAGALVEVTRWLALGASAEAYASSASLGGLGGSGSMIIALRL